MSPDPDGGAGVDSGAVDAGFLTECPNPMHETLPCCYDVSNEGDSTPALRVTALDLEEPTGLVALIAGQTQTDLDEARQAWIMELELTTPTDGALRTYFARPSTTCPLPERVFDAYEPADYPPLTVNAHFDGNVLSTDVATDLILIPFIATPDAMGRPIVLAIHNFHADRLPFDDTWTCLGERAGTRNWILGEQGGIDGYVTVDNADALAPVELRGRTLCGLIVGDDDCTGDRSTWLELPVALCDGVGLCGLAPDGCYSGPDAPPPGLEPCNAFELNGRVGFAGVRTTCEP